MAGLQKWRARETFWLNCSIASLLYLAALAKIVSVIDVRSASFRDIPYSIISLAVFEATLATWLLVPRFIVARQLVSGATFAIFFVASLMNLIEGQTTCGCFGEFQVRPLVMVLIDAAALFALTTCDWRRSSEPLKRRMALSPVSVAILAGVALAAHSFSRHGPAKGEIQILETADWPGRAFPFDSNLLGARGSELGKGSWIVLLYHTGCAKCAFEMQRLRALSVKERATGSPHLAAIEIPPYASDHEHPRDDGGLNLLRLRNDRAWFVATPQVIYVRDGQVVRVADHLDGKG